MSNQNKFFNKKKLDTKNVTITAVNISGMNLVTGDEKGVLGVYEISKSNKLVPVKEINLKSKIEKICVPPNRKIAFVLAGGDVYYTNLPKMDNTQALFKTKDITNVFINKEDQNLENMLLVMYKKKKTKIKIYDFEVAQGKAIVTEQKKYKDLSVEELPQCATWIANNYLAFNIENKIYRLNCETGETKEDNDFDNPVEIISLGEKLAISNHNYTLFMKDGKSYSYSMVMHATEDFHCFCEFKNHLFALYNNNIGIFKAGQQAYEPIETINFDEGETGKFIVASNYKLIVLTVAGDKTHFIDFQERPYEEQIKALIDQKQYDKGLEKLIENIPEDDNERQLKVENVFLDCAWACLEGKNKDYQNSVKYLSLTNFNPFEFIYMFIDALNINIIHTDKKKDITDRRKENQFFGLSAGEEEQKEAYKFLIKILKLKRDYILDKKIKANNSGETEASLIEFMSSERSRINLKESNTKVKIRDAFYAINSALIKSLIKLREDPKEIEAALDNETINYSQFNGFEKEEFFKDEKNKNLEETKFTLSYISEKNGNNYELALEQWEKFGKSADKKYSLIGRDRTKKIFYKFKENKNTGRDEKERLFRKYIQWLLEKYQEEAFEVVIKTDIVSPKIFMEEIIPEFNRNKSDGKEGEDLKEKYLEYCNNNQKTENYQTQLLQLYVDKLFTLTGREKEPEQLEGEVKTYYDKFMEIITSKDSVYNKKTILEYIDNSWLKEPRIHLYSQLKEYNKALDELFNRAKVNLNFKEVEEFCKKNSESKERIFEKFYQLLSNVVKEHQEVIDKHQLRIQEINDILSEKNIKYKDLLEEEKKNKEKEKKELENEISRLDNLKKPYEDEMLKILKENGSIDKIDPIFALDYANDHWNICESNEFFNYLMKVVKDFTVEGNKYKVTKNLSEIGLVYKEKEAYEFKKKYVTIDSDKACDLCKKKIGSTIFVVYPNLRVYHSKCAQNINIDPMTGVDFSKKKYIE